MYSRKSANYKSCISFFINTARRVEEAIRILPDGISPGSDNVLAEVIKHGGEKVTKAY